MKFASNNSNPTISINIKSLARLMVKSSKVKHIISQLSSKMTPILPFFLYGDSRSHPDIHEDLATLMRKDVLEYNIPFVVHTGDFVTYGYDWTLWQEDFFAPARNLLSLTALLPAIGNHEVRQPIYYHYMDAPHNESWYHKRYGHADFHRTQQSHFTQT